MERADASMTITKPFPSAIVVAVALTAAHSSSFLTAVAEGARCWSRLGLPCRCRRGSCCPTSSGSCTPFVLLPTRRARCSAKAYFSESVRCCRILYAQASTIDWDDYNSIGYVVADHLGLELLDWQEVPWVCTGLCAVRGRRPPLSASLLRPAERRPESMSSCA